MQTSARRQTQTNWQFHLFLSDFMNSKIIPLAICSGIPSNLQLMYCYCHGSRHPSGKVKMSLQIVHFLYQSRSQRKQFPTGPSWCESKMLRPKSCQTLFQFNHTIMRLSFCFSTNLHAVKPTVDCTQSFCQPIHIWRYPWHPAAPCIGLQKGWRQRSQWSLRHLPGNVVGHRCRTQVFGGQTWGQVELMLCQKVVTRNHVLCCRLFNRVWKQRSTEHLILAVPCYQSWVSRLIISSPAGRVRRMATTCCCVWFLVPHCPPPKHEPDVWWGSETWAVSWVPFVFHCNLWDTP